MAFLLLIFLAGAPAFASDRIGAVEFFGYKGLDVAKIRDALPVHEGDEYSGQTKDLIRQAVMRAIGKEPTEVGTVCCDEKGNTELYIGLPGESYKRFTYNAEPKGDARLSPEILNLYSQLDRAIEAAVHKGGDAAQEDDSQGYALMKDPDARSLQLAEREWAINHEPELRQALASSFVEQRRAASEALGYANQSHDQIVALVQAARDPDGEVRNNATRALGVLVRSNAAVAATIPPDTFIEMLSSGTWTDRNKGAALLVELTAGRNADLLAKLRAGALDSLIEMASWRAPGHSITARIVLGRVAGLPEDGLMLRAWNGPVDEIIEAARRR